MKRFLVIWFMHLKTDWMIRQDAGLKKVPFVIACDDRGRKMITEVSAVASGMGIESGMVVSDARVIIPSLKVVNDEADLARRLLTKISHWAYRFTPCVSPDIPDGLILDITGCAHLWNGETNYLRTITEKLKGFGYHIRAAIADTIGAAWAVCHYGNHCIIAPGQQHAALKDLHPLALRLDAGITDRLLRLGLYHIGNFMNMDQRALRRRFGQQLTDRLNQALGTSEERVEPLVPPNPYEERLPCMEPIMTLKGIEMALEKLLEQICRRLGKEGNGIRAAAFKGFRTDGKTECITISTNRPSLHIRHLFKLFEIKFSQIEPALGIELFTLTATKVQQLAAMQQSLWSASNHLESEDLAQLLDRIEAKFGKQSVCRYLPAEHHMPERSIKIASQLTEKPAVVWRTDRRRPVHILPKPEIISVTAPIPDYPPMNFKYKGRLHQVKKADGPERIEPELWLETGFHRDYYVVEDEEGKRFWLFRLGHYSAQHQPNWYVHGFFS